MSETGAVSEVGTLEAALGRARALLAGQPAKAAAQSAAILAAVPHHPEAELLLGVAHRRLGNLAEARAVLEPLVQKQPRSAEVLYEWALTQAELAMTAPAVASLRRAVALRPQMTEAWRALGDLLVVTDEPALADAAYAQHIRTAVHDPVLMAAAGTLCDGDLQAAEHTLREHLRQAPTDVAALRMLAEIGTRLGRNENAEALLIRCLELAPSFTPARYNLAIVLSRQSRAEEAIPHLEKLLSEEPRNPAFRNLLAVSLALVGEFERAIEIFASLLGQHAEQPKIWLSYGHALKTAGRRVDAVAAYRRAAALAPHLGEAYWSLANMKAEAFVPGETAAMQDQLARRPILTAEDRFHLHYALGRALEQAGDFAGSFGHYAEGARLRRTEIAYNADRITEQFRRTQALMSADFFAAREGGGCDDPAPIFIVGLPRSGSTLIEQILASHSAIEGTMELPELANMSRDLGRSGSDGPDSYPETLGALSAAARAQLGQRFLDRTRVHRKTVKRFFIDKMPNNFVHIGLIHLILPRAIIIDARRHPMAACFSAFKQHFARGQHFSYDQTELGRYYRDYTALMEHFDAALPGRILRVNYEDVVNDTEAQVRRLLAWCGLAFEPACLKFHENTRAVRTASSEQVRQPIYREGLDHWRNYQAWLGPLAAALGRVPVSAAPDVLASTAW